MDNYEIIVSGKTDIGKKRLSNQDNFFCISPKNSPVAGNGIIGVADGMGGHAGGEIASELALKCFQKSLDGYLNDNHNNKMNIDDIFFKSVEKSNACVYNKGNKDSNLRGMGTTLTIALIDDKQLIAVNVGDSRGYLISNGTIKQITKDHSWVAEQVEAGLISESEAKTHPRRNVITRSIGTESNVDIDIFKENIQSSDVILLCSDGLYSLVSDEEILRNVNQDDIDSSCKSLVDLANQRGGHDNITVVIAKMIFNNAGKGHSSSGIITLDQDNTKESNISWFRNIIKKIFK